MVYVVTYRRRSPQDPWPLDNGDDPAFASSLRLGGRVTWGVCRTDVRRVIQPGDGVVFFAADRLQDRQPARYQFVGYATVDRKVRHTDIWKQAALSVYRDYGNLLLRPAKRGFEHFEPEFLNKRRFPHRDWVWRIADTRGFRTDDLSDHKRLPAHVNGRPVHVAENYIIFGPEPAETLVLAGPPVVATVHQTGTVERWSGDRFSRKLFDLVLGQTNRHLRTTNAQRAHRHIVIDSDREPLFSQLRQLCRMHGFHARSRRPARQLSNTSRVAYLRRRGC